MSGVDLAKIPKERWAVAAGMVMMQCFTSEPLLLLDIVAKGEDKFVREAIKTDTLGLHRDDYKRIFGLLAQHARKLGYNPTSQQ